MKDQSENNFKDGNYERNCENCIYERSKCIERITTTKRAS